MTKILTKKYALLVAMAIIVVIATCALLLFDTTTIALAAETPSDLRGVKVGDDLSGATIFVDYSKLSFNYCAHAVKTDKYIITQNNFSARYFGYGYNTSMSSSTNIKDWAYPSYKTDPQTHAQTQIWVATSELGGGTLNGIVSYTLPEDFGVVTALDVSTGMGGSVSTGDAAKFVLVSASAVGKFKGLTYDDGISAYSGLELRNTMFAVKKPVFTKTFAEMAGSSDVERAYLFTTTYSYLIRTNTDDIIIRYSNDGGKTFTEKYLWQQNVNKDTDIVYLEYDGYGQIYSDSKYISETTSWLRIVTAETYTIRFVDQYGNDSSIVTKRRGDTLSMPYITQPSTPPLVTYSWICDQTDVGSYIEEDRTYTKTMYINNERILTNYIGNMQTVNDGFPSMLKFYVAKNTNGYVVYVSKSAFQEIVDAKILEADKTKSEFIFKLHSLNTAEQNNNYLTMKKTYDEVCSSVVGSKSDVYWYAFEGFTEKGSFDLSEIAQAQLTVTMTFDDVIFKGEVDVPVEIYGYVKKRKDFTISVNCTEYYNGEIDIKLPLNFWENYSEFQVDDALIHKFVFEEDKNPHWAIVDNYYTTIILDTIYIKQDTTDFVFTNNLNDKKISLPINKDAIGNYYVSIMLDNPLQVNYWEFSKLNGWRDKFEATSTLSDLKYCSNEAKTFIRSMLSCDNYTNYDFGQSGYYITGLPGHSVYSTFAGDISTVTGMKVIISKPMITEYDKTYRLTLISDEEYTKEESKIPSSWFDEVWNGVSGTGSSVFDGIKTVLWIVLSIALTVVLGKIIAKLIGKSKNKKNGR